MSRSDPLKTFRIASYNLENLRASRKKGPPLEDRIQALRPQLLKTRADVLCLQEIDGQPDGTGKRSLQALDALLEGTPFEGFERTTTISKSRGGARDKHNLVTVSRFPVVDQTQVRHDLIDAPLHRQITAVPALSEPQKIDWDRPFLHLALDLGGDRTLNIINLHLRAPRAAYVEGQKEDAEVWKSVPGWAEGFFIAAVKRAGQALEVRLFVDSLFDADKDALIAVVGDFNADDFETPVRTICGDADDICNPALVPRVLVPLENSVDASRRYSVIHGGHPRMLDHLLASPALRELYRETEVFNEGLLDELYSSDKDEDLPGSFHAPVVSEFNLPVPK